MTDEERERENVHAEALAAEIRAGRARLAELESAFRHRCAEWDALTQAVQRAVRSLAMRSGDPNAVQNAEDELRRACVELELEFLS